MDSTAKTHVIWFALLAAAALLYGLVQHRPLHEAATLCRDSVATKAEYSIVTVGPSLDALRAELERKGDEGWEVAAPVVNNGTTFSLSFNRESKQAPTTSYVPTDSSHCG